MYNFYYMLFAFSAYLSLSLCRQGLGYEDENNAGVFIPTLTDEHEGEEEEEGEETDENEKDSKDKEVHFDEVTEVRFPGEVGPLGDRRLCKIRCVKGKWVGPLCATNEEGNACLIILLLFI